MISSRRNSTDLEMGPDLTPLLDIIFIVMVFLLLTANISIKTMNIELPTTDQTELLAPPKKPVIAVNLLLGEPSWAIAETPYQDWSNFSKDLLELSQQQPDSVVLLVADKNVTVESMLRMLAFMQKNQINTTNIMMDEHK